MSNETEIRPFRVDMPDDALADLQQRIAATRWPTMELIADRSQGVQLATTQELARYWTTDYDWRACEAKLNALPQFTTEIDGVDIHFLHVRSPHEDALPLLMTHGWPGSVIELLEAVGPLTDPTAHGGQAEDAFDLVLPSLPGYGFSGEPADLGWKPARAAQAWACVTGRRPGRHRPRRDGPPGTPGAGRHPHELARDDAGGPYPTAGRHRGGTRGARGDQHVHDERLRLLPGAVHAAADDRLRAAGFPRRPGGLAAGPRYRQLRQDHSRLCRRPARGQSHPRHDRRQPHPVLADGDRGLGGPVVLGARTSPGACRRPGAAGGLAAGRLHHLPRRDLPGPAELGRAVVPHPHLLQRGRQGRSLRRLG